MLSWGPWYLVIPTFLVLWYVLNGYSVGVGDHGLLTPMAQRVFDANFLEGDYLFSTVHPTLTWYLYAPFVWLLGYEAGFALLHLLCLLSLALGILALIRGLGISNRPFVVWAYTLALMVPVGSTFAGIETFDAVLLPRVVSLGPLLFALALASQGRFVLGFLTAGLVFNLHPTTAAHAAVLVGGVWLASGPRAPRRLLEPAAFFAGAAPLLALIIGSGDGGQVAAPYTEVWLQTVTSSWPFHHFPATFEAYSFMVGGVPWLLWLASRVAIRSRVADAVMISIAVFCALGYLFVHYLRIPQMVALHVFESTRFAHYIAAILVGGWFTRSFSEGSFVRAAPGIAAGTLYMAFLVGSYGVWEPGYAALLPLGIVLAALVQFSQQREPRTSEEAPKPRVGQLTVVVIGVQVLLAVAWLCAEGRQRPFSFSVDSSVVQTYRSLAMDRSSSDESARAKSGLTVMRWAQSGLPDNALVAIPPYMLHPLAGFRVIAERRPFVTWKDGSESVFSEAFAHEWRKRIAAVTTAPVLEPLPKGAISWGDYYGPIKQAVTDFNALPAARLRALKFDFQVTHVLRAADAAALEFPLLYEDEAFRVYRLP